MDSYIQKDDVCFLRRPLHPQESPLEPYMPRSTEGVVIEAEAFASLFDSKDKEIGVNAFLNRKTPQWEHK